MLSEWAKHCHAQHYLGLGCPTGPMLLCVDCARAYAHEVGETVQEGAAAKVLDYLHQHAIALRRLNHVLLPEIAATIRQIEVKTP